MADKAKILIVEDEIPLALLTVHVLSRIGCDVQFANSGKKGMELAQETRFDLITLDIDLPDINGLEICRKLKQRHISHHTPIIFISGRSLEEDKRRGFELGAVDYIEKPFEVTDFISRIVSHAKVKTGHAAVLMRGGATA